MESRKNKNMMVNKLVRRVVAAIKKTDNGATTSTQKTVEKTSKDVQTVTIFNPVAEKPKFDGLGFNAVKFLRTFNDFAASMNWNDGQKLRGVRGCLIKDAANWMELYIDQWSSFKEFEEFFLRRFWSDDIQDMVKRKLEGDIWEKRKGESLSNHFAYYVGLAKTLKPPIEEKKIISTIMRHFPASVQTGWMSPGDKDLTDAIEYLSKQDQLFIRNKELNEKRQREHSVNSQIQEPSHKKPRSDKREKSPLRKYSNNNRSTKQSSDVTTSEKRDTEVQGNSGN